MFKKIFFFILISVVFVTNAGAWTNPLTMKNEWSLYGIGDPFIMKYRGTYYLYASTKDNNIGIKCWSTKDFVTWSDAVMCSTDPITKTAYAPEVYYWNGVFYMYTSPGGNGHFVLTSNSPTGPFVPVTGNFGKSIDGSIFINDDGNWFFYHADGNGIMGCSMSSPTTFGTSINLNARMGNNWTEGPCVVKRNGTYYLFYTGNHVISKGYRVDYAKNTSGPISQFIPQAGQNPILINTEGSFVGLGHGAAFIGPDLDSYYFTYHNLAGDYGVGPYRRLNFDRIAWNGDKLLLLGPTTWKQQPMQLADMTDYFDRTEMGADWEIPSGGNWSIENNDYLKQDLLENPEGKLFIAINKNNTSENYTAEFTLKEESRNNAEARYGVVFDYKDEQNYGIATLKSSSNQIEVNFLVNNSWETPLLANLPRSFKHNTWHTMRVVKFENEYKFFIDGMLKITTSNSLKSGKIGYLTKWSHADFGYIAFSNKVNGSGIFDTYKSVPGSIEAVHYIDGGEGVGYSNSTVGNSGGKYIRNDDVDIVDCTEGGHSVSNLKQGEWLRYNLNVKKTGIYNVGLRCKSISDNCQIRIWQGDVDITGAVKLISAGSGDEWRTITIKDLQLSQGFQNLKVEVVSGSFDFYKMQFEEADNSEISKTDEFNAKFSSDWNYSDGNWSIINDQAIVNGFGKRTMGNVSWSDYTVQTDIVYTDNMNGGLIFRVNNPALGGAGNNPSLGTDFYQGYFVTLGSNSVVLGKQNYSWTHLKSASGVYSLNTKYTIKVSVEGDNIKVFVDDMETPKIDYTDPNPFINGKVGLRSHNANVKFDNFNVTTFFKGNTTGLDEKLATENVRFFPNPVNETLTIVNEGNFTNVLIYDLGGKKVFESNQIKNSKTINVSNFQKGIYLLQLRADDGANISKKFMKI